MAKDKTVISIPSLYYYQYAPNTAANMSQLTYNEGIYIDTTSLSVTYPKSVVRVYKNKTNPKKIYLLSKDTTIFEAVAKKYANSDNSEEDIVRNWPSLDDYLYYDRESYPKYSTFTQPSNFISLDINSLTGKTINFYSLNTSSYDSIVNSLKGEEVPQVLENSRDIVTKSGVIIGTEDINEVTASSYVGGSYILKSKSLLSDFTNKPTSFTEKQLNIFNASVYAYWFDKQATINNIKSLSYNDISLFKSTKINNVDNFNFNSFVEYKYENLWVQKIDNYASSQDESIANNYVFVDLQNSDYLLTDEDEMLINIVGKFCLLVKNDILLDEYYKNKELFVGNSAIRPDNDNKIYGKVSRLLDEASAFSYSSLGRSGRSIFSQQNSLNFNDYNVNDLSESEISETKPLIFLRSNSYRITQFNNLDQNNDLTTLYIFNDNISDQWDKYGFIPDDPNTTIYELQLEEELDVENGSFLVVEIE